MRRLEPGATPAGDFHDRRGTEDEQGRNAPFL